MSFPEPEKTTQTGDGAQQSGTAQQSTQGVTDSRQQAIEQEEDTARVRSERKSVEDGADGQKEE